MKQVKQTYMKIEKTQTIKCSEIEVKKNWHLIPKTKVIGSKKGYDRKESKRVERNAYYG